MIKQWLTALKGLWFLWVALLLVVLGVGAAAAQSVSPRYTVERQTLFISSPQVTGLDEPVNPFLSFVPSLGTAVYVMSVAMTDPAVAERLVPEGSGASYEVGPAPGTAAPVLLIRSEAPTSYLAAEVAAQVESEVASSLATFQRDSGAPESTLVRVTALTTSEPQRLWKPQIQVAVIVWALGVALIVGLMTLVVLFKARSHRTHGAGDPGEASRGGEDSQPAAELRVQEGHADSNGTDVGAKQAATSIATTAPRPLADEGGPQSAPTTAGLDEPPSYEPSDRIEVPAGVSERAGPLGPDLGT